MQVRQKILGNAYFKDLKSGQVFRFVNREGGRVFLKIACGQVEMFKEDGYEYIPTIIDLEDGTIDFECHFHPNDRVEIMECKLIERGNENENSVSKN